ncbi:MAG: acetyl-CoA decarbonylase/synthase complex subunit gamma, partial [Candidatus Omnitrophica bacterium]|nr:acetyl-CoA decarbonylase/synthase complex subunit gamma [Candidatus Omnitrophota bacterium]
MALSGLDIYKLLPKTNCKDCGFATCLAFAMALAQKKVSLEKCPHVSAQARDALESASQPPIKLVTVGVQGAKFEVGNETVMYRHEQKFHHPCAIGFLIDDTLSKEEISKTLENINELRFERVGQVIRPDLVCVKNTSGYRNKFLAAVSTVEAVSKLAIALYGDDEGTMAEALKLCREKRPLIVCGEKASSTAFINLAKEFGVPMAISCASLEETAEITTTAKAAGVDEIVINLSEKRLSKRIQYFTYIRRSALKKNFRPLGYPVMAFTEESDPVLELAEAVTYVTKYAGIIIVKNTDRDFVYPLLVARQDIYQDPQKPVQVEAKVYEIGKVTRQSPVLVTTNFSITYFTVAAEVE